LHPLSIGYNFYPSGKHSIQQKKLSMKEKTLCSKEYSKEENKTVEKQKSERYKNLDKIK